ncbi:uncharacterized protein MYCFIDRAFT_192438 [Pseudocercospora fijiensis CIRAD86]|uniref:GAR domain-containing protein n=1 Tax=Pseudocercospora fijiensis (strain CIRAD86) TaxID=383855 RepID=N1Q6R8_PSEFD|nr:uncharacterized protein MYCFIDRAFT_192438 [Pseudocercospora fijiensis CIRAD86]EME88210.1 hypothetical protein MYCFIDRAFT_192438 [Pseudocercospora fijiensis CIRAD86]
MPLEHPFANRPHIPPPTKAPLPVPVPLHIRTKSRSPSRQHARALDPLLRDLSPTTTLRACSAEPDDMDMTSSHTLIRSIHTASPSQRALAAKAASTCLHLRTWAREIDAWQWPGTFDIPKRARRSVVSGRGDAVDAVEEHGEADEDFWGSLPASTVRAYEKRADEIGQHLDEMDVEELKDYVLNSHYRVNSRPPSRSDAFGDYSAATVDLKKLDDFTALVTATILQALPFLSKLHRLLDVWTIRLIILRSAPNYLRDLKRARHELDRGWAAISTSSSSVSPVDTASLDRQALEDLKAAIQRQVGSLGRRLDRFLDDLEGRDDCVPDTWVDDFELLESAYGTWVVQADRKVLEDEWHRLRQQSAAGPDSETSSSSAAAPSGILTVSETEDPDSDDDAVRRPSQDVQSRDQSPWLAQGGWSKADTVSGTETLSDHAKELRVVTATMSASALLPSRPVSQPVPLVVRPELSLEDVNSVSAISAHRSVSSGSSPVDGESQRGQLARKRAAFLNAGIEQSERLNMSKSPVRPFEHASNAFTKLFKKDRSPEQIKPKRTLSSRWRSAVSAESADRKALSPVSLVSSQFNSIRGGSSAHSEASHPKSSVNEASSGVVGDAKPMADSIQAEGSNAESHDEPRFHTHDGQKATLSARDSIAPATYKPTGLNSPFHSPSKDEFPENWPLASPSDTTPSGQAPGNVLLSEGAMDEEASTKTPAVAIETDVFDRMFVQSLPQPSLDRSFSARTPERPYWSIGRKRTASLPRPHRPSVPAREYLDMVSVRKARPASLSSRPRTAPNCSTTTHIETLFPLPDFAFLTASTSRDPRPKSATVKTFQADLATPDAEIEPVHEAFQVKRASLASIELFSRADLKSIDVPKSRHNSVSPRITPPHTPPAWSRQSSLEQDLSAKMPGKSDISIGCFPTPPYGKTFTEDGLETTGDEISAVHEESESPVMRKSFDPLAPPLNPAMPKRRVKEASRNQNTRPMSPGSQIVKATLRPDADNFDRHVSDVLDALPAPIKFKPRLGAETPVSRSHGFIGPRPKAQAVRGLTRSGDLTIVPAESSPKKSTSSSDPEVKLYHLTQSGRDDPIKLFVRIVGEGEQRVMVRVGGGWTDLADYLIGFAQHHGSRTVSEGNLEVQTVTGANRPRKASGPAEFIRTKSPMAAVSRPESSDGDDDVQGKPLPFDLRGNGLKSTPKKGASGTQSSTPKSISSSSRPSTATLSRPPSRQTTGEVGLSGPSSASKRAVLPEHSQKWVDGMIQRAKQASAEKCKEDKEKHFSELSKAGGTRRLYFRPAPGASGTTAGIAEKLK